MQAHEQQWRLRDGVGRWGRSTRLAFSLGLASLAVGGAGCAPKTGGPDATVAPTAPVGAPTPTAAPAEPAANTPKPSGPSGTITATATLDGKPLAGVAVWVVGASGSGEANGKRLVFHQKDNTFYPTVGVVMKGGMVEFVNDDTHLHNTYSHSPVAAFSFNQAANGSRSLLKVDKEGIIDVACHIHGLMRAWIVVVDSPAHGVTDSHGAVTISGVAPGTYRAKAFAGDAGSLDGSVTVKADGPATVAFKFSS